MRRDRDEDDSYDDERPRRRRERDEDERPRRRGAERRGVAPWVWGLVALGAVLFFGTVIVGGALVMRAADRRRAEEVQNTVYVQIDPDVLVEEWERNPAAAAAKYQTTGIEFTGTVKSVGENHFEVAASRANFLREIRVWVSRKDAKDGLLKLAVGKPVHVKAHSKGDVHDWPSLTADNFSPIE